MIPKFPKKVADEDALRLLEVLWGIDRGEPDAIRMKENLSEIESVDFHSIGLLDLPDSLGNLSQLSKLDASDNSLSALPDSLGNLSRLSSLDVSDNKLYALPDSLGNLSRLSSLDVSRNQLSALPDWLGSLSRLSYLSVSGNQLSALPDSLGNLSWLSYLSVNGNQLSALPDSLGNLSRLSTLSVSNNQLSALPDSLGNLSQLSSLDVFFNQLSALPDSLGNLSQLSSLVVSFNQLSTLPDSLGNLSRLSTLDVSYNELSTLPDSLGNLSRLSKLSVTDNQLSTLPHCIERMSGLKQLDLRYLRLKSIPHWLVEKDLPFLFNPWDFEQKETGISLFDTTLTEMDISLFEQNDRALIEQWYAEHDRIATHEAKVIFLGDGEVGKTYTIRRLLNDGRMETADEESKRFFHTEITHGILIKEQETSTPSGQPITLHYWDFGGQTIMHSMHRVFLTRDTVYVILLSGRKDGIQMARARYWLRMVESFAKDAPILLLVNLCDHTGYRLAANTLQSEFPDLSLTIDSFDAKLDAPEKILALRDQIATLAGSLHCFTQLVPRRWENIRREVIRKHREERIFCLPQEDYHTICRQFGMEDTSGTLYEALLERFNILGDCFSYYRDRENARILLSYKVLNPEWLTNAVYLILEKGKHIAEGKHGILTNAEIQSILKHPEEGVSGNTELLKDVKYEEDECGYVLDIMRQHRLSYRMPNGDEFIPTLLPDDFSDISAPQWWEADNPVHRCVRYEVNYTYLPDSVLHQLMVCCRKERLTLGRCWNRGMWIEFSFLGLEALVDASGEDNTLKINLYTNGETKPWKLLAPLREAIREIDTPMGIAKPKDKIITDFGAVSVDALLNSRARGNHEFPVGDEGEYLPIDELLGDYINLNCSADDSWDNRQERSRREQYLSRSAQDSPIILSADKVIIRQSGQVVVEQAEAIVLSCNFQQLLDGMERHLELVTEELLSIMGELMYDNMDRGVRQIAELLRDTDTKKEKRFENIRAFLGDTSALLGIGQAVSGIWPDLSAAVCQHAPELFRLLR